MTDQTSDQNELLAQRVQQIIGYLTEPFGHNVMDNHMIDLFSTEAKEIVAKLPKAYWPVTMEFLDRTVVNAHAMVIDWHWDRFSNEMSRPQDVLVLHEVITKAVAITKVPKAKLAFNDEDLEDTLQKVRRRHCAWHVELIKQSTNMPSIEAFRLYVLRYILDWNKFTVTHNEFDLIVKNARTAALNKTFADIQTYPSCTTQGVLKFCGDAENLIDQGLVTVEALNFNKLRLTRLRQNPRFFHQKQKEAVAV